MKKLVVAISLGIALGLFQSCSSSDDNPHNSPDSVNPNQAPNPITSLEGIIVKNSQGHSLVGNVVLYTNNATIITIDGVQCSKDDLQGGMIIEAKGNLVNDSRFDCTNIDSNSLLRGNIDAIDLANNTLVVANCNVVVDEHSYLVKSKGAGNGFAQVSFADLQVGHPVSICGTWQSDDIIRTTRVCSYPADAHMQPSATAQGLMSSLATNAKTFQCGKYIVNYSNASVTGTPENGCQVVAAGPVINGIINAERLVCQPFANSDNGNYGCRSVYGRMSGWDPANGEFQLSGGGCCSSLCYWVYYDEYTPLVGNVSLANGVNVRVEGTVTQNGRSYIIKATKITK
jgi:hypothetical protein